MLLYSIRLTFWALAVVPLFVLVTFFSAPIIRKQLREQAEANARVQSHLVETLGGMETIKGQGMKSIAVGVGNNCMEDKYNLGFAT